MRTDDAIFTRFLLVAVLAAAIGMGPGSWAQNDPLATSELEEREEVRLIELNLIAVDEDGLVTDLDAESIDVMFEGQALEIAGLQSASDVRLLRKGLPMVRLQLQPGSEERIVETALAPPRYWVFLIDVANEVPGEPEAVKTGLEEFIRGDVEAVDYISVLSYTGDVRIERSFTTDRDAVVEAVNEAYSRPRTVGVPTHRRVRSLMQSLRDCQSLSDTASALDALRERAEEQNQGNNESTRSREDPSTVEDSPIGPTQCARFASTAYFDEMRSYSDRFYAALEGAVRLAGDAPGVPTVFAVSHGATAHPQAEFIEAMRGVFGDRQVFALTTELDVDGAEGEASRVAALAVEQGVTVHFVDPATMTSTTRSARDPNLYRGAGDPIETAWIAPQKDLRLLAEETGGLFTEDEGVIGGLRDALAREQGRYILDVYAPEGFGSDDRRALQVSSRRPGVRIIHRYLPPDSLEAEDDDFEAGMAVRDKRHRDDGEPGQVQSFLVGARLADLDYAPDGNNMVADLTMRVWVETAAGDHLAEFFQFFRHSRPREKWESALNSTLAIRGWIEAPPGDYRIVGVFRNAKTGKQGRAVMEINVPES